MGYCSKVTDNVVAAECGSPATAGTGARVVLMNFDEVDKSGSTVADNVISALLMDSTKTGFSYESLDDSTLGTTTYNKGTYFNTYQHDVDLRIFSKSEASKAFFNELGDSKVMAIVENLNGGETKYELYGWDSGLQVTEATGTTDMADNVVYDIKIGSGEKSKEGSLPKSVWDTDETTTDEIIEALLV